MSGQRDTEIDEWLNDEGRFTTALFKMVQFCCFFTFCRCWRFRWILWLFSVFNSSRSQNSQCLQHLKFHSGFVWFSPKNDQIQIGSESKYEQISQSLLKSHWNPRKILLDLSRPLKQLATPELRFCFRWFGNTSSHQMFIEIYTRFAWWDVSVYLTLTHTHSISPFAVCLLSCLSQRINLQF